ncbi:MAG TPA: EF-hand domain-containing protein [Planctomycetaceae bacterium]|nr:EF-hand domain-containing protein [Planctomycetaceae bacterium]
MLRRFLMAGGVLTCAAAALVAQPPGPPPRGGGSGGSVDGSIERLMAFDANKDGKLSKEELNDERLTALFERVDANKDGSVTKEELTVQLTKEAAALGANRGGGPGGPGFGGPGFGGPGGFVPPAPGTILPQFLQDELRLSDEQKKQLSDLQKEVDTKLAQILNREQRQQLNEMGNRGPRGPGGNRPPEDGFRQRRPPQ